MSGARRLPALVALVAALHAPVPASGAPQITRDEIITIAKSGVGCPYVWGGTCWDPNKKSWKGADCSGFVSKCWQIPTASATTDCGPHYYSSSTFVSSTTHWQKISRDNLDRGDALVRSGHVMLYEQGDKWGAAQIYEAEGAAYGIVYHTRNIDLSYQAIRRNDIVASGPPPAPPPPANLPPKGGLDGANCKVIFGWAQDPDAKATAIDVHIYIDGAPGQSGAKAFTVRANRYRADLCTNLGSCEHAFELPTPAAIKDGKPHPVRAYAIDSAGGSNPELYQSPRTITCTPPPPQQRDAGPPQAEDAGAGIPSSDMRYGAPDPGEGDPSFEEPEGNGPARIIGGCDVARAPRWPALDAGLLLLALLVLARRMGRS